MPNDLFHGQFEKAPCAWSLVPLKMLMTVESGKEVIVEVHEGENAVPVYGSGLLPFKFTDRSISSRRAIVFGRKGTIGQPYLVSPPYWLVDTAYYATPKNGVALQYLYFLLSVFDWQPFVTNTAKPSLVANDILTEKVPCPSVIQQEEIVEFLESKTTEIDALIEKLSRQVELLERYRRELIARTVTRGLNPDVPIRDSGIEWIGKIPEHWVVERLQWRASQVIVDNDPFITDQILSLVKDVGVIPFEERGSKGNKAKTDLSAYKVAFPGTIVMNSMNVIIGSVGISNDLGLVSPVYYVFKNKPNTSLRFLNYAFRTRAFQKELRKYANGILEIRLRVSASAVLKRMLAFPPLEEQRVIADYLDEKMSEIDATVSGIRKQIELLGKYREQMINDAVTGKVRVGEVA